MTKIKKIAAAAMAAITVGSTSMIAFASTGSGDEFTLKFERYQNYDFTNYASKYTPYSVDAQATAHRGASSTRPVEVYVTDGTDEAYNEILTSYATIKANYETVYMSYSDSGTPGKLDEFYLNGYSKYHTGTFEISGLWKP